MLLTRCSRVAGGRLAQSSMVLKPFVAGAGSRSCSTNTPPEEGPAPPPPKRQGFLARRLDILLEHTRLVRDPSVRNFVSRIAATGVYCTVAFTALGTLGVDTTPLVAGLGISSVTLGFAAKDAGSNIVSGLMLSIDRPFKHGDKVQIGVGGNAVVGVVESFDLRYITLMQGRNRILIPNATALNSVITLPHSPPLPMAAPPAPKPPALPT
eukprot:TRINITY_DN30338_c0_g1_i2.p1 TRINITY_DN30338_c0_g1~~TRINITY_DN30338_c0_g1_i2.p1  ORF type:complete len:210 (-),score=19.12 TRINITY_DN30338_c0_g1_i2:50-679(-)